MKCLRILTEGLYLHMRGSKMRITEDDAQAAQVKPDGTKPPAALSHRAVFCLPRLGGANTLKVRAVAIYERQTWFAHLRYALRSDDYLYTNLFVPLGITSANDLKLFGGSKNAFPGINSMTLDEVMIYLKNA